ncbi:hypothetical protein, partial [Nevskia ramosa]|uniref:hypothetical protein n=1 Tax=Nevskia ramosa TaxID=64002 RepID=UPI002354FC59
MNIQTQNNVTALVIGRDDLSLRNQIRLLVSISRVIDAVLKIDGVWLAGGSLRSAFDGTPVKDYDLFFRDTEAKRKVKELLKSMGAKITFVCPQGSLM